MSKFSLDLNQFKKVKADKATTTLKHIKHGHEIKLAHGALSPDMKSKLDKLPMDGAPGKQMFADGGQAQPQSNFQKNSKKFDSGYNAGEDVGQSWQNLKNAFSGNSGEQSAQSNARGGTIRRYAYAGEVEPNSSPVQDPDDFSDVQSSQPLATPQPALTPEMGPAKESKEEPKKDEIKKEDPIYNYEPGQSPKPLNQAAMQASAPQSQPSGVDGVQIPGPVDMPQGSSNPMGNGDYFGQMQQGLADQFKGQQMAAQSMGALGAQNAKAEEGFRNQQAIDAKNAQDQMAPILGKNQEIQKWLDENPVNAKNYIQKMTTGGKIGNAIGLILSGIGSGLTHGPNLAYDYLNNQINHDIDAQKQNIGTKENLLSHNMRELGNIREAETLTRMQHNEALASVLRQNAGQAQNQNTAATLMQLSGQFKNQNAQLMQQMYQNKLAFGNGGASSDAQRAAAAIKLMAPPAQQEKLMKDLETKQNLEGANKDVLGAFDYAAKNNTILGKVNPQNQSRLKAVIDSKLLGLAHASAGRFNMEELPYMRAQFPNATDDQDSIAVKRQNLLDTLNEKAHFPSLEPYGIRSGGSSQSSGKQINFKPIGGK